MKTKAVAEALDRERKRRKKSKQLAPEKPVKPS
jgi:hypothetical protein